MKNKHLNRFFIQLEIIKLQFWKFLLKLLRKTLSYFSYILTTIVTIITIARFFNDNIQYENMDLLGFHFGFNSVLAIIAISSFMAAGIVLWPKLFSETKINKELTIIVECCNLFVQQGVKVVHATDTFDIKHIKKKSVFGQFVQLCQDKNFDLSNAIRTHIPNNDFLSVDYSLPGEKQRYKLGSICPIAIASDNGGEEETFCLVAFSHVIPNSVHLPLKEYRPMLLNMWRNLSKSGITDRSVVNVTVMGNRFVEFPASYTIVQKIGLMVETFCEASRQGLCCHTLKICIDKYDAALIDFANLNMVIKYVSERASLIIDNNNDANG